MLNIEYKNISPIPDIFVNFNLSCPNNKCGTKVILISQLIYYICILDRKFKFNTQINFQIVTKTFQYEYIEYT